MLVFGRALLAFLVCLPPGTFRSLGAITESAPAGAHRPSDELAVQHLFVTVETRSAPDGPHFPMRGRSWDKLIFTFENEVLVESLCREAFVVVFPQLDREGDHFRQFSSLAAGSSLQAHRTPREILIATREFLI